VGGLITSRANAVGNKASRQFSLALILLNGEVLVSFFICLKWGANDLHMVQLMLLPLHHLLLQ